MNGQAINSGSLRILLLLLGVRWKLFVNSLRSQNRRIELVVQAVGTIFGALFVLGASIGIAAGTVAALSSGHIWVIGVLLWVVFLVWQFAPVLLEGYSPGVNFREIARYPVTFGMYVTLNCAYGLSDPAALTALLWLAAVWGGVLLERPSWSLPVAGVFLLFAAFNVLCNRLLIGLLERFQSTRRGRERMAVVLLLLMVTPQLVQIIGVNWDRLAGIAPSKSLLLQAGALNRLSPPGAALNAFAGGAGQKLAGLFLLAGYAAAAALLLHRQSKAAYLGEVYSDSARQRRELKVRPGWKVPGFDDAISAVIEKEFRYLRQNSRLLVQLVYPMIIFAIFFSARNPARQVFAGADGSVPGLAMLTGFVLLSVANISYNIFGLDREGFGRWLLSPVRIQKVLLAKNISHAVVFIALYLVAVCIVLTTSHPSPLWLATLTVAFLTVLILQLGAGNLFSAWWPKHIDLTRMNSRMVSNAAGYASFLIIGPVGLIGGMIMMAAFYWKLPWLPLAASFVLLCIAAKLYFYALDRAARYVQDHIEEIEKAVVG